MIKVHYILWLISTALFVITVLNAHGAILTKDYVCVPGHIENVEETTELTRIGYKARYSYDIVWINENQYYRKKVYKAIDKPDENVTEVWVSEDNSNAIVNKNKDAIRDAIIGLTACFVLFIMGRHFAKKYKSIDLRTKSADSLFLLIAMNYVMLLGFIMNMALFLIARLNNYYNSIFLLDLALIFFAAFAITLFLRYRSKK